MQEPTVRMYMPVLIPGYRFELGKGATLRDGTDVTIIAVGMNVQMALAAAEKLAAEGISARVIDMHTIKPLDTELVLKAAKETGAIVTTEEANVLGGLGAAVAEYLSENYPVPVVRHGVNDEFAHPVYHIMENDTTGNKPLRIQLHTFDMISVLIQ